ncbi:exonuclease SbcCD subunit D C-terminal domain-containing protein [Halomonas sp. HP20-15]|uniref:exonuclease SbcCD subunit D n=1 Tax=Halomonas sp. HP20-15 TaxID=3085901 RepID=UPI002981E09F|nr:exonuclease SbcCD subunit D C-terminal domain-containing protein [Halomonas sp. HP20-15]MDW5376576.1 exonuclease SbcCD subunit D C-terminal domain-containing protein [Halomonas sp. HP20-15]
MKLLHTADWHLGQTFHGQERHVEHRAFLDWLLETLAQRHSDALLIAGDIFDVVNPSLRAQQQLYDFIVSAHQRLPRLTIVLIAGNHDSGARIELPGPLLERLRTHALGRVIWLDDDQGETARLDAERLLIPLETADGQVAAWCLALPFLRPAEVTGGTHGDDYVSGVERVHRELIECAEARRRPGQALVAMSHAHIQGASVSADSERPIVIGGEESLPSTLFPASLAYVALGHLHRPQQVGEARIRYSGSPLPMDFSEVDYPHQVVEVTLDGEALAGCEAIRVPRAVALLRVGPASLDAVLAELEALDSDPEAPRERWPWLEVRVELDAPRVDLRASIEQALTDKTVRLIRIQSLYAGSRNVTALDAAPQETPEPTALFAHAWEQQFGAPPDDDVTRDFASLLTELAHADPAEDADA